MDFRYMNPGLVSFLDSNTTATQFTGYEYSNTGYAFTQTNSTAGVTLPRFRQGDDFWAKFDFYLPPSLSTTKDTYIYCSYPKTDTEAYLRIKATETVALFHQNANTDYFSFDYFGINKGAVNSCVIHVIYDTAEAVSGEFFFPNGSRYYFTQQRITYNDAYAKKACLYSNSDTVKFSNVIFSNEEISPKESVIQLPGGSISTAMTAKAGGMYSATAIGQTFLQSPDVSALAIPSGANAQITGIQVVGNPAYRTTSVNASMIGISQSNDVLNSHNSVAVGSNSSGVIMDGWSLSGVTLGSLSNMQFGWQSAV